MKPVPGQGIALLCNAQGEVISVVRDDLGLAARVPPGSSLLALADAAGREKAQQFIATLGERQAAFDWEINVPMPNGELRPLHFAAVASPEGWLVAAAHNRADLEDVHADMMRIQNESLNALRIASKDLALALRRSASRDDSVYEELSRVNNELANLQRELAKTNAALEQANAAKKRVLAMVAHDLRSPLSAIQTYAEFLQTEAADRLDAEQRGFVDTISHSSHAMVAMIGDLLDFSAIESGQLSLQRRPELLATLLTRSVGVARALGAPKRIAVTLQAAPGLPPVAVDAGRIGQVMHNLLSNALKFSHPDRAVTVVLEPLGEGQRVRVVDQGQGIAPDDQPKLFQPYGRTRTRSTAGESSTGLGLAIVRKLVEAHGGTVGVDSRPGEGSTFWFTLPSALHEA